MNWFRTIRARLLFWYFASLILLLGVLWAGSWYATRLSMNRAIDKSLSYKIEGIIELLSRYSTLDRPVLARRLEEGAGIMAGGGVFRVYDSQRANQRRDEAIRHRVGLLVSGCGGACGR